MTAKRFTVDNDVNFNNKVETYELNCIMDNENQTFYFIADSIENVQLFVKRLNELHEENQHYKHILQDLGLLMTDEEVRDIRTEIADKFIKPLCKENGFDIDVDCTNGFTIIPKGDDVE